MEVKGELIVTVNDPNLARLSVKVAQGNNPDFQFKVRDLLMFVYLQLHPNMNKPAWNSNSTLELKDASRTYPKAAPSSVLKWRWATTDEKHIPLSSNFSHLSSHLSS